MPQIRVLWADDQADVAATLAGLLPPEAIVTHVSDGRAAVDELAERSYDLVVLDLAMPPGDWGGLWVLEQLASRGVDVPTIVLSGEGSQTETIKAMRFGADYVKKEDAALELIERVKSIGAALHTHGSSRLEDILPAPLAVPYRRLLTEIRPADRLRRVISAAEAILRYVAVVNICSLARDAAGEVRPLIAARDLRAPSMGTWLQLARSSTGRLTGGLGAGIRWKSFDVVVEARNDLHHGGQVSDRVAAPILARLEPTVEDAFAALPSHRLLYFRSLDFNGRTFTAAATRMHGHSPTLEHVSLVLSAATVTNAVNIEERGGWLCLDPLMRAHPAAQAGDWEIHSLDGIRWDGRSAVRPDDPLLYCSLWAGERRISERGATVRSILELLSN